MGDADDRNPGCHRLGDRQPETFTPCWVDITVRQVVEPLKLTVVEITIDPPDVGWVRVTGSEELEELVHLVVGVGIRLEHQRHVTLAVEHREVGLE